MDMHKTHEIDLSELLSPSAASRLLPETSAATLQRWARQGKLPVVKMPSGRLYFSRSDIEALLDPVLLSEERPSISNKPLLPSALSSPTTQQESSDVPLPGFEGE